MTTQKPGGGFAPMHDSSGRLHLSVGEHGAKSLVRPRWRGAQSPLQLLPGQLFAQLAPGAHWKVQLPPSQVFEHVDPAAQAKVQLPPVHVFVQVEFASQT